MNVSHSAGRPRSLPTLTRVNALLRGAVGELDARAVALRDLSALTAAGPARLSPDIP